METFTRISVQKAHEIIETGNGVTIVDIRDEGSFAQGHIPQAKAVNDENIEEFLRAADKEIPLVCYCYHGISSQKAAGYFAGQGFKQVYSIDGGWEEWKVNYG
jgi:thiosulfate sulfurtransferase